MSRQADLQTNKPQDEVERERLLRAQEAGQIIYGTLPNGRTSESGSIIPEDNTACCGIMSPVRRTFCLVVLFDLLLSFILWVIYTQLIDIKPLEKAFAEEVGHYTFKKSLFDSVMVAACRFVPLQLAYALYRIRNPSVVAITTAGTCIFLLAKIFLYNFEQRYLGYAVLVVSFIIAWVEAWFLDFKVLPREKKAREREAYGGMYSERQSLLSPPRGTGNAGASQQDPFYSPVESEDEDHERFDSTQGSRRHSRNHSRSSLALSLGGEEKEYLRLANLAIEDVWDMFQVHKGWKLEAGVDGNYDTGCVHSKFVDKHKRKVFRIQGYVDTPPNVVFDDLVTQLPDSPKWNKTVLEAKVLLVISDNCDVVYTVAAEGAGGLVSSRDFVSVRKWEEKQGRLVTGSISVKYAHKPASTKHVRGENGATGWVISSVPGNRNKCLATGFVNTDLKGWIPQFTVDKALSQVLMDYLKFIRIHMKEITQQSHRS